MFAKIGEMIRAVACVTYLLETSVKLAPLNSVSKPRVSRVSCNNNNCRMNDNTNFRLGRSPCYVTRTYTLYTGGIIARGTFNRGITYDNFVHLLARSFDSTFVVNYS